MAHFCVHPALGILKIIPSRYKVGSARHRLEIRASKENGGQLIRDCPTGPLILVETPYPPKPDGSWHAEHVDRGGLPGPFRFEVPHLLLDYCADVLKVKLGVPSRPKPAEAYGSWLLHRQRVPRIAFFAEPPEMERGKVTLEKARTLGAYIGRLQRRANGFSALDDSNAYNILLGIIRDIEIDIFGLEEHQILTEELIQAFVNRAEELEVEIIYELLSKINDEERKLIDKKIMYKATDEQKAERLTSVNEIEEIRNFLGEEFGYKPSGVTP